MIQWIFADIRINRHFLLQDNVAAVKRGRLPVRESGEAVFLDRL